MENVRQERASAEIAKALDVILREKINDPRIKRLFITITYVKTSADFRHAKVGFSVLNANKTESQKLLQKMEGFIKKELLQMVKLPYAPELTFVADLGEENSERINDILKNLNIPKEEQNDDNDDLI